LLEYTLSYNDAGRFEEVEENSSYLAGYTINAFEQRVVKDVVGALKLVRPEASE
jgi:hypothetical protein